MRMGQLSESDAVDALRVSTYTPGHPRGPRIEGNHVALGNIELKQEGINHGKRCQFAGN